MSIPIKTELLYQNITKTPLGHVDVLVTLHSSPGPGWDRLRVFGAYALVYLVAGQGTYADSQGITAPISPGDLITVFPDIPHRYGPRDHHAKPLPSPTWSEIHITFEGPIFDLWRSAGLLNPATPITHLDPVEYWYNRFRSIVPPPLSPSAAKPSPLGILCRLQNFLAEIETHRRHSSRPQRQEQWLLQATTFLDQAATHGANSLNIPHIARKLNMPYDRFRKQFAALTGTPPNRYAMTRIIQHARQLIHAPPSGRPLTNRQLADLCGFHDEFHFSRRFKQILGLSPRQYRQRLPHSQHPK